jgi:pimeloyl-ACP methyl ester carboxylesterase
MRKMLLILPVLLLTLCSCSSLLYYPTGDLYVDINKMPVKPEELHFRDAQGKDLAGWYFTAPKHDPNKPVILFFHGNGQNISAHFFSLYWILEKGYDYFIFDYPGYGPSPGDPTPQNTVEAGQAALKFLLNEKHARKVSVFAQSLGGAVGMRTVIEDKHQSPICLLTVESTFPTYQGVGADVLSRQWWSWLFQPLSYLFLSDRWAPGKRISEISPTPFIVIHGDKDPIIDEARGRQVFAYAKEPKEFWEVPGGSHIDAFMGDSRTIYQSRYLQALAKHCQ